MYRSDQIDWDDPLTDHPLNKDLVGAWLCGDENPYWGGPKILDLTGRNHGTLTNMLPSSATSGWQGAKGRPGGYGCLAFDGSNDSVQTSTFSIQPTSWTISCWLRPSALSGFQRLITGDDGHKFGILLNGTKWSYQINNGGQYTRTNTTALSTGNWYHITTVTDISATTTTHYLNGVADGSFSESNTPSSAATYFYIGNANFETQFYSGFMDDIRVYTRSLSAGDAFSLYQQSCLGHPDTLRRLRRITYYLPSAPPGGLSIPIAMYHYKRMMGVC